MSRLPVVKGKDVVRALERADFRQVRQRGSRVFMAHPDRCTTVVPVHAGQDIDRSLLRQILREANLSRRVHALVEGKKVTLMAEQLLPIVLRITGKRCVVVGGGEVALQKVTQLLECNADVTVISPEICPKLQALVERGCLRWLPHRYEPSALDSAFLAFVCTDDNEVNRRVFADCQARRIWCNVVDVPELCHFFMPSILRRGELVIAVSTSGNSPAFARRMRLFLETVIGDEFGTLVELLGELKDEMRTALETVEQRRQFMERVWDSEIWTHLRNGDLDAARACMRECLTEVA